jgi:DNA-binding NtrC family response regulator
MNETVLLVEDDTQNRELLVEALTQAGLAVKAVSNGEAAFALADEGPYGLVISDIQMGPISGLEVLRRFRDREPDTPVVLLTAFGGVETAIQAMKSGAFDYLTKPVNLQELILVVRRAIEHFRLIQENRQLKQAFGNRVRTGSIIGQSRMMLDIFKRVGKVAPTDASVLIYGESGTGKELIARAIHDHSDRASGKFMPINCSAIPETLFESELFGHTKNAFTGADRFRRGLIEEADGGTLFLDEVGDLPPLAQAKILRVLQDGEIRRLGSNESIRSDFRVIAATKFDLDELCSQGEFREDLLYRLKTVTLTLPRLADRKDDIPALAEYFLSRYSKDDQVVGFAESAIQMLKQYSWPGNVRELEHVIEQAVALADHRIISKEDLSISKKINMLTGDEQQDGGRHADLSSASKIERSDLVTIYRTCGGNKARMANSLGMTRWSLYRLLQKHGIGPGSLEA